MTLLHRRARRHRGTPSERGAALVEFALSCLLFFVLAFAVLDFGRLIFGYTIVSKAARQGVRYAAVRGYTASANAATAAAIKAYVASQSLGYISASNVTVKTIASSGGTEADWPTNNKAGQTVKVTATYTFLPAAPFVRAASAVLSSTAKMVIIR